MQIWHLNIGLFLYYGIMQIWYAVYANVEYRLLSKFL
jgi:hypothetical protein